MRRALLVLNALGTAVTLLSALAVLGSLLLVPAYRLERQDSLLFVLGYVAVQAWFLWAFVRDTPAVPWIAVAKALAGLFLVATFKTIGPDWIHVTPARYVYQLFDWSERLDWGPNSRLGLYAFVFLGRGLFNTFSAFELTRPSWWSLRETRPLLGRLLTAIPLAAMVTCVWLFFEWRRLDVETFSAEASEVARLVLARLGSTASAAARCATARAAPPSPSASSANAATTSGSTGAAPTCWSRCRPRTVASASHARPASSAARRRRPTRRDLWPEPSAGAP